MADVFSTITGLLNMQANTNLLNAEAQDYKLLGQERAVRLQRLAQDQQDESFRRQLLMDMAVGKQGTQFRGDQKVDGDPLISELTDQSKRDMQNAQQLRQIANAMQGRVSLDAQAKAQKEADDAERVAIASQKSLREEQSNLMKHVGSIAGSAVSANSDKGFQDAYQQIAALNPSLVRGVDRDPNGIPVWGPESKRIMTQLRDQGMDASAQLTRETAIKGELLRERADARADQAEKRLEEQATASIAASQALTEERRARTQQIQEKTKRMDDVASKPAQPYMKDRAKASIMAMEDFKDAKFDSTLDAFAGDVADRANKIRAEEFRSGEDIGLDEARDRAIAELKRYVTKGESGGFNIPVVGGKIGGEEKWSYRRGTPATRTAGGAIAPAPAPTQTGQVEEGKGGKKYKLKPGADPTLKESWELVQ